MSRTTEHAIIDCTIRLAEKKSIKKITVKNIADSCGITRNTFYYYFHDIYDVIDSFVDEKLNELIEESNDDPNAAIFGLIEFCVLNKRVFMNLYHAIEHDQMASFVIKRLRRIIIRAVNKAAGDYVVPKKDLDIICTFYEEAICGVLIRWLRDEKSSQIPTDIRQTIERERFLFSDQLNAVIANSKKYNQKNNPRFNG